MYRQIGFEIRKITANGRTCAVLLGMIVCNLIIGMMASWGRDADLLSRKAEREAYEQQIETGQLTLEDLSGQSSQYRLFQRIAIYEQEGWEEELAALLEDNPDILEAYESCRGELSLQDVSRKQQVMEEILLQQEYFQSYTAFRGQISQRAQQMQTVSIWGDANGYSNRNIRKTAADFEKLQVRLQPGSEEGINWLGTVFWTDWLFLCMMLFLGVIVFKWEKAQDALGLPASCRNGRYRLGAAKVAAVLISGVCAAFILYGTDLLLAWKLYGYGPLERSVQSVSTFQNCGVGLTVGEYLICFFLGKQLALLSLSLLMCFFLMIFPGILVPAGGLLAFMIAEYLLRTKIGIHSPLRILRYWNLFTFTDIYELVRNYRNFNVFGYPVNILQGWGILSAVVLAVLPGLLPVLFVLSERGRRKGIGVAGMINRMAAMKYRLMPSFLLHSQWYWEIRSYLVKSGGVLLAVCALAGFFAMVSGESRYMGLNTLEAECEKWVRRYAGEMTDEKEAEIEEWNTYFADAGRHRQSIEEAYAAGELTKGQYDGKLWILDKNLEKQSGFQLFYLRYEAAGRAHGIASSGAMEQLLRENKTKQMEDILLMIWSVLLSAAALMREYRNKVLHVIRSTAKRGKILFLARSISCVTLVWLITGMRMYWRCRVWSCKFSFEEWNISVQSILNLQSAGIDCSILQYVLLIGILQALGLTGICLFVIALTVYLRQAQRAILAGSVLFVVPCALLWIGVRLPWGFGIQNLLNTGAIWEKQGSLLLQLGSVSVVLITAIGIWCAAWLRFGKAEGSRHRSGKGKKQHEFERRTSE